MEEKNGAVTLEREDRAARERTKGQRQARVRRETRGTERRTRAGGRKKGEGKLGGDDTVLRDVRAEFVEPGGELIRVASIVAQNQALGKRGK